MYWFVASYKYGFGSSLQWRRVRGEQRVEQKGASLFPAHLPHCCSTALRVQSCEASYISAFLPQCAIGYSLNSAIKSTKASYGQAALAAITHPVDF